VRDKKIPTKLASTRQQNGKQPLTKTGITVSAAWKKGYRTPKKKMDSTRASEGE